MHLQLLTATSHANIYHDTWNDWLFVDWLDELTLADVQAGCLELAGLYRLRCYPRVLNSNAQVRYIDYNVAAWLASEFLPGLGLAGVEQLAWVWSPQLNGRNLVQDVTSRLPSLPVALFDEVEAAVTWLQQRRPDCATGCSLPGRSQNRQQALSSAIEELAHKLQGQPLALS